MGSIPINQNVVPLLQGLKPYLGSNGKAVTEGALSLIQLVTSNQGQDAVATMGKMLSLNDADDDVITIDTTVGTITFSLGLAFTLFLILILLILSGSLLAFHPRSSANISEDDQDTVVEGATAV